MTFSSSTTVSSSTPPQSASPYRLVVTVGGVIGLCILGDSLMYAILPLQAAALGIPLPLIGVLLSANRLIRLISNTWASNIFERLGPVRPFLAAVALSLITTTLYGVGWGFAVFLIARMLWGVAWSSLRQGGYQAIWTGASDQKGRLTGLLWGLVRLGSAVAALGGGFLYDRFGYGTAVGAAALLTAVALPVVWTLTWPAEMITPKRAPSSEVARNWLTRMRDFGTSWQVALRVSTRRWLAASAFTGHLLQGVVIGTTSLFLAERLGESATLLTYGIGVGTITGMMLGTRWIIDLLLGPAFGYLSDRLGQANIAMVLCVILFSGLIGMALLPVVGAIFSLLLVFICDGGLYVVLNAAASGEAMQSRRPHLYVGVYTTMSDAGSALGPLLAFTIGARIGFSSIYLVCGLLLIVAVTRYRFLAVRRREVTPG